MRRWNGWGDTTISYALAPTAADLLHDLLGPGLAPRDVTFEQVIDTVPPTRLPPHPLVTTTIDDRVRHARGQSFPDLVALRSGQIDAFPDGVAYPMNRAEVRELLGFAQQVGAQIIPYGGGTSVVGHINALASQVPILTVDLRRLSRLHHFDPDNRLATFGAGIAGPDLEAQLRSYGYTLGHFPQSLQGSTLGGWVATRSTGQQSLGYGRIEHLFAGGHLEAPAGNLDFRPFPASSAGPDLRELVLGSEGRLGILTEVTVRITPLPQHEVFHAVFFPDWERGLAAVQAMAGHRGATSMLRLSTAGETAMNLALAGHPRTVTALKQFLRLRGLHNDTCMLLVGFTGDEASVKLSHQVVLAITRQHRGIHVGRTLGQQWQKGRFRAPYLRNDLWERGYAVDTVETATSWSNVSTMIDALHYALAHGLAEHGEHVHAFTHLSHVYPIGSSVYTTFVFRLGKDAETTRRRWLALKTAASHAILTNNGTISHQHGIGVDHRPYLEAEKGLLGITALQQVARVFDPTGLLNPGKLI